MKNFTLAIIVADNLLNWFLGISMTFFPAWFAGLIYEQSPLPQFFYLSIGIGFLLFSAWQVVVFLRNWKLPSAALKIAAWLAWIPVVGLTVALLSPLAATMRPTARTLLIIGDVYMLLLGGWYWWVAKKQN